MSKKKLLTIFIIFSIIAVSINLFVENISSNKKVKSNMFTMPITYVIVDSKAPKTISISNAVRENKKYFIDFIPDVNVELTQKGNYFVGKLPNLPLTDNVVEYLFTKNNLYAEKTSGCIYNKKTREIKIPKKYYKKTQRKSQVQMEILSKMNKKDVTSNNIVSYVNGKKKKTKVSGYNTETTVSIYKYNSQKSVAKKDIIVNVNDSFLNLPEEMFDFNSKAGTIDIKLSPLVIKKVKIKYKRNLVSTLLNVKDVLAASYAKMSSVTKLDKNPNLGNTYSSNKKNVPVAYRGKDANGNTFWYGDTSIVATDSNSNSTGKLKSAVTKDIDNFTFYQSCNTNDKTCVKYNENEDYFVANISNREIKDATIPANTFILMYCAEHDRTQGGINAKMDMTFKMIAKGDKYVIISITTDEAFFTQKPAGIYKFVWDEDYGTISVKKYYYNNGNRDQETPKNGTFGFTLYEDTACSVVAKDQKVTNENSNVNFNKLPYGTYGVKETLCDNRYYYCDTSCHSVTLNEDDAKNEDGIRQEIVTLKYHVDENGNYSSDADNPIKNYRKYECFSVEKKSDTSGSDLSNIGFQASTGEVKYTTPSSSIVTFGPYPADPNATYTWKEISTNAEHYIGNQYDHIAVKYEASYANPSNYSGAYCSVGTPSEAINEHVKYCTRIVKKDKITDKVIRSKTSLCTQAQETGQRNPNYGSIDCSTIASTGKVSNKVTTYNLCSDPNCANVIKTGLTSNEFGLTTISGLTSYQDYYIRETQAPDGYTAAADTVKIPKEQLHEYRSGYDKYCSDLLSENTNDYSFNESHLEESVNASSYNHNLNVYFFGKSGNMSSDVKTKLATSISEVNNNIRSENEIHAQMNENGANYTINPTKIRLFEYTLDSYNEDSSSKKMLKSMLSNLDEDAVSNLYEYENGVKKLINAPFVIIGKNVFYIKNSNNRDSYYSGVYNLYNLKTGTSNSTDSLETIYSNSISNRVESFFENYLEKVTDEIVYSSGTFSYKAGPNSVPNGAFAYYDLYKYPNSEKILNRNANNNFNIYVLTTLEDDAFSDALYSNNSYDFVIGSSDSQRAIVSALSKAITKLNNEVLESDETNSSDYYSSSMIKNINLNQSTISNGITFRNADLYPNIGNALSGIPYFAEEVLRSSYSSDVLSFYSYSYPIIYINNRAYYYTNNGQSIGNAINYGYYLRDGSDSYFGSTDYDEDKMVNYFYSELKKHAMAVSIHDDLESLVNQVGAYQSIRTPIGYQALINGTSEYGKQETYDGTDAAGFLRSIPVYNYKYKLNWYKETEGGVRAAGAKFTVSKGSTQLHHAGESNKVTLADNNGVTKTCYFYSTNASDSTEFVSDANGEACILGLEEGTYTITETVPASYHTFDSKTSINQVASENFRSITNETKFVNYETKFEFTKTTSNDNAENALTTTFTAKLPDGTTGNISYKDLTTKELMKIPFRIYAKNSSNPLTFVLGSDGVYEYTGNLTDGPGNIGAVTDLFLNENRKLFVEHLPIGTYEIKEADTQGCSGANCENCKGYYYPEYDKVGYEFTISNTYNSKATQTLNNINTEINFTKEDLYSYIDPSDKVNFEGEEEVKAFDSITFKIKDANNTYLKLQKVGDYGNCNTTSGYSLYRYVPSDKGDGVGTELHTCGGNMKITHLCRDNTYKIEEIAVPKGSVFTLPNNHPIVTYTIPKIGNTEVSNNNRQVISDTPTRLVIHKKDDRNTVNDITESSDRKETAIFEVYRCTNLNQKCTYNSSTKEALKFYNLAYIDDDNEDAGERVYKYITTSDEPNVTNYVTRLVLNEKGRIILRYLPGNYKYVVVERNAPDGYYNLEGENAELETYNDSSTTNNSYNFTNIHTQIKFVKDDIYKYYEKYDLDKVSSINEIFDSMTFVLRNKNGQIVKLSKVQDGEYRFIGQNGSASSNTVEELHTKDGEFIVTHLYRGETYYIEEIRSDTLGNFILPNNINNTSLVESEAGNLKNNKHPIVKYNIPLTVPNDIQKRSLTQLIENAPTRVVFEKRDAITGELIDDLVNTNNDPSSEGNQYNNVYTTFNVYRCDKDVSTCSISNGTLVYFTEREYVNDLTTDITNVTPPVYVYKYSKLNQNAVKDLHTDRGLLVLAYLPSKYKYVLYETVAPNGYYNPTTVEGQTEFTVKDSSIDDDITYESLTTKVDNEPTKIIFKKKDMYDYYDETDIDKIDSEVKMFDSMRFVLRNKEGEILSLKCTENGVVTDASSNNCKTGEYRYLPYKNNENLTTRLQTINGEFKITHLYRGETYYIEEIKEDTEGDFILPDYLNFADLPFDNKGHPVVKYVLPENVDTDESITRVMENTPTRVIFQKRDSKYNYLIPDETTTFEVYQCSNEVDRCTPEEESAKLMYFKPRATITGDNEDSGKEVYRYSKLNNQNGAVKDLHPYLGELILRYLPAKYKYVLVETVAPKNYTMPTGINAYTYFTISETKVQVDELDVPNKPTSVVLRKYDDKGNLLTGAKFKVYKKTAKEGETTSCNPNLKAMDQVMEEVKLKTVYEGIYEARETTDTSVITTCTNRDGLNCNELTGTLTYEKYVDSWLGLNNEENPSQLKTNHINLLNEFNDEIETYTQIKEGEALIQYLEYNHCYIFEEVEAPKGYSLPSKKEDRFTMLEIKENDTYDHTTYKTFVNMPTPYQFYKFDEFNNLLDGAKFKLQRLNKEKIYEDVTVSEDLDKEEELADGSKVYRIDENTDNTTIETFNGTAIIYYLSKGQYRVVETEAPAGKELGKTLNVATFFVNDKGEVFGNRIITNKSETKKIKRKNSDSAALIVNIQTGQTLIRYGLILSVITALLILLYIIKIKFIKK